MPPSTALPERIEKAKVMNTGDKGTPCSWGDLNWRVDEIKNVDVGPRILRFLETPVAVVDIESGRPGVSSGSSLKRRREGWWILRIVTVLFESDSKIYAWPGSRRREAQCPQSESDNCHDDVILQRSLGSGKPFEQGTIFEDHVSSIRLTCSYRAKGAQIMPA
jgi:hypothetical protein